jgi:hypothetical protein
MKDMNVLEHIENRVPPVLVRSQISGIQFGGLMYEHA